MIWLVVIGIGTNIIPPFCVLLSFKDILYSNSLPGWSTNPRCPQLLGGIYSFYIILILCWYINNNFCIVRIFIISLIFKWIYSLPQSCGLIQKSKTPAAIERCWYWYRIDINMNVFSILKFPLILIWIYFTLPVWSKNPRRPQLLSGIDINIVLISISTLFDIYIWIDVAMDILHSTSLIQKSKISAAIGRCWYW